MHVMRNEAIGSFGSGAERLFRRLASRYVWRWPVEKTLQYPRHLIAQVMDIGTFEDARELIETIGEEPLRQTLAVAEPGWLSPRSWAYWHYRLHVIAPSEEPPPLPQREYQA